MRLRLPDTVVVNMKTTKVFDVKIDRTTIFGNPFRLGIDGDRDSVLAKYRDYFYKRVELDKEFRQRVLGLRGRILACWCSPERCHGEVIGEWLNSEDSKR